LKRHGKGKNNSEAKRRNCHFAGGGEKNGVVEGKVVKERTRGGAKNEGNRSKKGGKKKPGLARK